MPHPDKEIESALDHARRSGWKVEKAHGHAWGRLKCPWNDVSCRQKMYCQVSIWSTPQNPGGHARALRRVVDGCIHVKAKRAADDGPERRGG